MISADIPSVRPFDSVVRIAHGVDDWQGAIQDALAGNAQGTKAQRREVAALNGWDGRVANTEQLAVGPGFRAAAPLIPAGRFRWAIRPCAKQQFDHARAE